MVGDLTELTHLYFLFCIDGIPAFKVNGITLMPAEFLLLSLPPWMRYKEDNMFISMLIPSTLSAKSQKKYFDYVLATDINPMVRDGLQSPVGPAQVGIFGQVVAT